MSASRVFALCLAAALSASIAVAWSSASAQSLEIRGIVRDSASGSPVAGAVVMQLDARGDAVARAVTRANGQFRLARPASGRQLHIVRLGFRPATIALPAVAGGTASGAVLTTLDIQLVLVPRSLQTVDVVAARGCPVRSDRNEALALLDQARAGLLATIVARERQPALMRVLRFDRRLDLDGLETVSQSVRIDSSRNATTSFNAVRNAVDFVAQGFRDGRPNQYTYFGPDADVLLDERFQRGYCFTVATRDSARPTQTGLHFAAATRRNGRVDIDGTVWIDTVARDLREIEYRYIGVEELAAGLGAGGRVGFRTLPNGMPVIDRWSMRIVGAPDTLVTNEGVHAQMYSVHEVGGELAEVRWPDEQLWRAPLSSVHVTAVRRTGEPAARVALVLAGTDYRAITDSLGRATIDHLVPGPFSLVVDDPKLRVLGVQIPTNRAFRAQRSSAALVRVDALTAEEYVASVCGRVDNEPDAAWIVARVVAPDGQPAIGAKWRLSVSDGGRWHIASDGGVTGATGLVQACRGLRRGASVELAAWRDPSDASRVRRTLNDQLTVIRIPLPVAVTVAASRLNGTDGQTVVGVVTDSASGAPVPDARVTFLGTPFEGASDSTGRFTVGGLTRGAYTVEVSTPWLDSIGAVTRRTIAIADSTAPLILFAPNLAEILAAACGAEDVGGVIVGRVATRANADLPLGLRVIAEWPSDSMPAMGKSTVQRLSWTRAPVETSGTFRLCGVPMGRPVVMRTEADSSVVLTAKPLELQITTARRFARADLLLDSAVVVLPTFTGTILSDSTGTPIVNAEVTLKDINRTVFSDARGAFRMIDVPVGPHLVSVRRVGYAPMNTSMSFEANRTIEHKVLLPRSTALTTVDVTANGVPADFEARRKLGVGSFISHVELKGQEMRRLSDVLTRVPGFSSVTARGGHAFVYGKRAPGHIASPNASNELAFANLAAQGVYCPTAAEASQGIDCACYAQIYLDDRLMNPGVPTEPFDINTLPIAEIAAIELYAGVAQTPGRYSNLNTKCGVVLVWTRRS